jgi:hypothetical protein
MIEPSSESRIAKSLEPITAFALKIALSILIPFLADILGPEASASKRRLLQLEAV